MLTPFGFESLPRWQKELIQKYPDIYLTPNPAVLEWLGTEGLEKIRQLDFCNLRYGFEFREGWKDLVDSFSSTTTRFVAQLRQSGAQKDAWVRSYVFKEKFGILKWLGQDNLEEPFRTVFRGYVSSIEERSRHVCEITGADGKIRTINGMMICLSERAYKKVRKTPGLLSWKQFL
jgi:hypothetical protein